MKRFIKRSLKFAWGLSFPIRRPIQARIKRAIVGCFHQALEQQAASRTPNAEINLVLDSILAELFRLQMQVDDLHHALAERDEHEPQTV